MSDFLGNLWQMQRPLMMSGLGFLGLFLVLAIISFFDNSQILGINRWIKPLKFSSSIVIYAWTLAVFLYFLRGYETTSKIIEWGVILLMVGEIVLIVMQAARGTTSHFNVAKPFDAAVFSAMGLMILANTLLITWLTILYFRADIDLPAAVVWGMRLGLIVFLLGSIEGGYMSTQLGHTVGGADGGRGLPFINWSVTDGDLRVAHFVGLHAFQAIPLAALLFQYLREKFSFPSPTILTVIFAIVYFSAFTLVFAQALSGKPVVSEKLLTVKNL
jgi:hypothetical protein